MLANYYIELQKIIESIEKDEETAKIILFFDKGKGGKVEIDKKVNLLLTTFE